MARKSLEKEADRALANITEGFQLTYKSIADRS